MLHEKFDSEHIECVFGARFSVTADVVINLEHLLVHILGYKLDFHHKITASVIGKSPQGFFKACKEL